MTYAIKGWHRFQHFKDRKPPWIKLYRDILDDLEWHQLEPEAAKALVMLWLIASEDDGRLPDIKNIAFRLRIPEQKAKSLINKLSHWVEQSDINAISGRHQSDAPETETETEKELKALSAKADDYPPGFQKFWQAFPNTKRKGGRPECFKVWARRKLEASADAIVAHVTAMAGSPDWQKNGGEFIPAPATYLNGERWDGADLNAQSPGEKPWFINGWSSVVAKGRDHGLREEEFPSAPEFRLAVLNAAGITSEMVKKAEAMAK